MFQFFSSRSTLFHQPLHGTHLTTRFISISDIHWRSPFTLLPSARPCVEHTLERVRCSHRRVDAMVSLPTFYHDNHRCFMGSLSGKVPTPPSATGPLLCLFLCFFFFWLICCFPLPMFTHVIVFGSLWLNTLFESPSMVTPALWHPCFELKGLHLQKHCPRVLSFLGLFLSCLALSFLFFDVIYFLLKKKKNSKLLMNQIGINASRLKTMLARLGMIIDH